jgi:hypothetical protein
MKKLIFGIVFLGFSSLIPALKAQQLNCTVSVDYNQVGGQADRLVFQEMQRAMSEYINFQEWNEDKMDYFERIRVNFRIIINQRPSADYFRCTANIQIYRPVYNSTYETVLANLSDQYFSFNYVPGQPLQFNENVYTDNLTALLNFYAYVVLGFDYASFSNGGGNPYFRKAQQWVSLAASSPEQGWSSAGVAQNNRFWLAENLTNTSYRSFQDALYNYHRQGLDQMTENLPRARRNILEAVRDMQKLYRTNPLLMVTRVFLDAKSDELIKVFQGAFQNDKKTFVEIMQDLDPSNSEKYNAVLGG